jgi:carbonic anhydrase
MLLQKTKIMKKGPLSIWRFLASRASKNGIFCLFLLVLSQSCAFKAGVVTESELKKMTPAQATLRLEEGAKRFDSNQPKKYNWREQRFYLGNHGAYPPVVVLSGTDARTSPELIFNQGLGDLFTLRSPASAVTNENVAAMEFACQRNGAKVILVLAQTKDPFIERAVDNDQTGNMTAINYQLQPAITNVKRDQNWKRLRREELLNIVLREHITLSVQKITAISPILRGMIERGQVVIVSAIYDVEKGKVVFLKDEQR